MRSNLASGALSLGKGFANLVLTVSKAYFELPVSTHCSCASNIVCRLGLQLQCHLSSLCSGLQYDPSWSSLLSGLPDNNDTWRCLCVLRPTRTSTGTCGQCQEFLLDGTISWYKHSKSILIFSKRWETSSIVLDVAGLSTWGWVDAKIPPGASACSLATCDGVFHANSTNTPIAYVEHFPMKVTSQTQECVAVKHRLHALQMIDLACDQSKFAICAITCPGKN